jgi:uncharacterized protein (TIGR03067 family)
MFTIQFRVLLVVSSALAGLATLTPTSAGAAPAQPSTENAAPPSELITIRSQVARTSGTFIVCPFVDENTGCPAIGSVTVSWLPAKLPARVQLVHHGQHQAFEPVVLQVNRAGIHVIDFTSPRHAQTRVVVKVDVLRGQEFRQTVKLKRAESIELKVVDEQGRPVEGAAARLLPAEDLPPSVQAVFDEVGKVWNEHVTKRPEGVLLVAPTCMESVAWGSNLPRVSDAQGVLRLEGLQPGTYRYEVLGSGFERRITPPIEVREGRRSEETVKLKPGEPVSIQIRSPDGKPVAGAVVAFPDGSTVVADDDGWAAGSGRPGDVLSVYHSRHGGRRIPIAAVAGKQDVVFAALRPSTGAQTLVGRWQVVSYRARGVDSEDTRGLVTTFTENKMITRNQHGVGEVTYTIDPRKDPKEISTRSRGPFTDPDQTYMRGIYRLEGDTLTICIALPGEKRPATFDSKKHVLVVYRRVGGQTK